MSKKTIKSLFKRAMIVLIFGTWVVVGQIICVILGVLMSILMAPFVFVVSLMQEESIEYITDTYKFVVVDSMFNVWKDSDIAKKVLNAITGTDYVNG